MASFPQRRSATLAAGTRLLSICRLLASLKLAVALLAALAVVLAWATALESAHGRDYTHWQVYSRSWFAALWGLVAVNVLAAMIIRFPWKRRHVGFLITHVGFLMLIAGALQTRMGGIEGRLALVEGETADSILLPERSQITVVRQGQHGQRSTDFAFSGGPIDWPAGRTLDFGFKEGLGVKVLAFYRHARRQAVWDVDVSGRGGPALKLDLAGPDGESVAQGWLPTEQFGSTMLVGPVKCKLDQVSDPSMLEDFRRPPTEESGKDGVLSMHYEGKMYRVPVHEKVGQKVPVGESGIQVEIAEYLPNAQPGPKVRFTSQGDEPKNPLLELRVHLPDEDQPLRQLAFAKDPLLTLDGVHGRRCPVRFWFFHPAVTAQPGAEFLRTPDGKLYCRVGIEDAYQWRGEVQQGDRIPMTAGVELSIVEYIPHARQEVTFQPVKLGPNESQGTEPAALVEVSTAGIEPQQVWLRRDDQMHGFKRFETRRGPLLVTFGYEYLPLDFSLELLAFQRGMNPGRKGDASFSSLVRLLDPAERTEEEHQISMNRPLSYGKFTFYQSSYQQQPDGTQTSILSVAYDPGRFLKYSGSFVVCLGTFMVFYLRGFLRKGSSSADFDAGANRLQPAMECQTLRCAG